MAEEVLSKEGKLHIVMFPWLAFGHLIPFLELSKAIARKGHNISFISTPRNIDRLPKIPQNLVSSFIFVKIPLRKVEGLPEDAESTMDIRAEDMDYLKKAYDLMETDVAQYLQNSSADAVVYDFASFWVPKIATNLGISRFFYSIFEAWFWGFFGTVDDLINELEGRKKPEDYMSPPKWITFDTNIALKYYEAKMICLAGEKNASGFSDAYRSGMGISQSDAFILRHCNEFDTEWLNLLANLYQKPLIPLGFLPPQFEETEDDDSENWVSLKKWLDYQIEGSVLYIALGSEAMINQDQLTELAYGLELADIPFLWAFREPKSTGRNMILPDGFEGRIQGRGIVWKGWAPQLKILDHDSVGGFLTHCGLGSTLEALMFGAPLILLPLMVDQWLNSRILEEKQIGVEVERNEEDGSFTRDAVALAVRLVMVEEGGKKFRDKAKETGAVFGNRRLHDRYVDHFISYLEQKKY
ncbi:UDP-rhamnose:rhamnosyltransferase 1-like [Dorcoceras hygrometricum]|uniref:Glycosyltransferase n=1 Tax=Dorcoceras hygrometricum TaxID=472368 RepID=A0A2Z7CSF1_9LAMI|nr:UDP-rhamnose:rhamnosyltransferase 1-like [Dorcoceras hygrometricum]